MPSGRRAPSPEGPSLDSLVKLWVLANKYAGAVFIVTAVILLLPETMAQSLSLEILTVDYRGYVAFALLVSGAVLAAIIGQQLLPMARRRAAVPLMKLVLPVKDAKNGVTQSRMRYYLVRFSSPNGKQSTAYMELDSNGNKVRYTNRQGRTVVPPEPSEETVLDAGAFQFPAWGKVDWNDVLHGEDASGCWGMRSPSRP